MGKTLVLDRVAADLARGLTHPAIQRLSSLVAAYPTDLDLRRRLAAVHRRVGNRIQAGRWDYLTIGADATDTTAFERAFPSAVARLRAVRWPHRASAAATSYARSRLAKLTAAAAAERPATAAARAGTAMPAAPATPAAMEQPATPKRRTALRLAAGPARVARPAGLALVSRAGAAGAARAMLARVDARSWSFRSVMLVVAAAAGAVFVAVGVATVIEWIVQ